jgi:tRNA threonylcarbamoyladenosine biosynthesis protein TsaB
MSEAVLALDTGSPVVSVALAERGILLASRAARLERSSTQLLGLIDETLRAAGLRPAELGGLLAVRGPGSFTGLRIALATALGLHQALELPATAISTFQALAAAAGRPGEPLLAVVDALRGEWSAQAFAGGDPGAAAGEPLLIRSIDGETWARLGGSSLAPGPEGGGRLTVTGYGVGPAQLLAGLEGVDYFEAGAGPEGGGLAAPAARWFTGLAAAESGGRWNGALLSSPLYSRPPAVTAPKERGGAAPG